MVKKLKALAEQPAAAAAQLLDSDLAAKIRDSAQQIWLAGLGAFAKAQGQGGNVFENLVGQGLHLQKKTQGMAEEAMGAVAHRMTAMAQEVGGRANASWDKLESIFEQRTAKAMRSMGMPSAAALNELSERVAALEAAIARLAPAAAPKKTAARKVAAKPPAKKVAARKGATAK